MLFTIYGLISELMTWLKKVNDESRMLTDEWTYFHICLFPSSQIQNRCIICSECMERVKWDNSNITNHFELSFL